MRRWIVPLAALAVALGIYSVGFAGAWDGAPDQDTSRGAAKPPAPATRMMTGEAGTQSGDFMDAMHRAMSGLSSKDIAAMHEAMAAIPEEQMTAMHRAMAKMTPEQMVQWCQAHARAAGGGGGTSSR